MVLPRNRNGSNCLKESRLKRLHVRADEPVDRHCRRTTKPFGVIYSERWVAFSSLSLTQFDRLKRVLELMRVLEVTYSRTVQDVALRVKVTMIT